MSGAKCVSQFLRFGYFPTIAVGVNGLAIAAIFSDQAPTTVAIEILACMAFALAFSFAAERVIPYNREWNVSHGDVSRDLTHFLVNESMSIFPLLAIPIFVTAMPTANLGFWPTGWPLVLQLLGALLIFDLAQTLFHQLSHVWTPLWRLHAVHHQVERMYGLNGILKHPVYQVLSAIVSLTPLVLLGAPKEFSLVLAFLSFTQLLIQHSNTDHAMGPLRNVFATAVVHRFHHLRGTAGDVNFALFFSFYDRLFGNAFYEDRDLNSVDIGLAEPGYPVSWWGQMLAPFRKIA